MILSLAHVSVIKVQGGLRISRLRGGADPGERRASGVRKASPSPLLEKTQPQLIHEPTRRPLVQDDDRADTSRTPKVGTSTKEYPKIDLTSMPGIKVLSQEPPVYVVENFLTASECDALVQAVEHGQLRRRYTGAAKLLDHSRLWPILPLTFLSALPGSHAFSGTSSSEALAQYLQILGPKALSVAAMLLLVPRLIEILAPIVTRKRDAEFKVLFKGGSSGKAGAWGEAQLGRQLQAPWAMWLVKCAGADFTGLGGLDEHNPARRAHERFLRRAEDLCVASRSQFEPVTVRRYRKGQGTIAHVDARCPPPPGKLLEEYFASGGQRLVQCMLYLSDVPSKEGGATKFLHPSLRGLRVQPKKGSALIFFPAFTDGCEDIRMLHIGEPYLGEAFKWTANCWIREGHIRIRKF